MTAAAQLTKTWSVNERAARAIALNARDVDDARLLLDMCGLVDGPQGREVLPDDRRVIPESLIAVEAGLAVPSPAPRKRTAPVARAAVATAAPAPKRGPGRPRQPIKHGSPSGRAAHERHGEPIPDDDACGCLKAYKEAQTRYQQTHYRKKRAAAGHVPPAPLESPPGPEEPVAVRPTPAALPAKRTSPALPPIEHGSTVGYRQHHERGALPACDACTDVFAAERAAAGAVALDVWFAAAQLSTSTRVRRAARAASNALLQLQVAMDDLARAERTAASSSRSTGDPA